MFKSVSSEEYVLLKKSLIPIRLKEDIEELKIANGGSATFILTASSGEYSIEYINKEDASLCGLHTVEL